MNLQNFKFNYNNNGNTVSEEKRNMAIEAFNRISKVMKNEKIDVLKAFSSLDIVRVGKISHQDLVKSFIMMNLEYKKGKILNIMEVVDTDNDGFLNF